MKLIVNKSSSFEEMTRKQMRHYDLMSEKISKTSKKFKLPEEEPKLSKINLGEKEGCKISNWL